MLELYAPEHGPGHRGLLAKGKLTDTDYQQVMIPRLRELIAKQGKARLMLVLGRGLPGLGGPGRLGRRQAFGFKHRKDFAKLALVGAPKWVRWAMDVGSHFMSGEVKNFPAGQEEAAWEWVTG